MKHFKQLLCLMMALLMIFLTFVACGEDPTEPAKNSDTTVADGTGTTVPSTNETTTPPMDETEPPVTEPPETEPPVTNPPVTNPPETVPPCEVHTFETGKLCTEERVCTVCRETVPAGEHAYYDGPCTAERSCRNCEYVCPASAAHVFGAAFSCGTQKCENCSIAMYGRYCERDTMSSPCKICGLTPPSAIPFITIDGIAIKEFTVVIPEPVANQEQGYEYYVSAVLRNRIQTYHKAELPSVTDTTEKTGPEIRIGLTNRTVSQKPTNGSLLIQVTNGNMEILCDGLYAYEALLNWLSNTFCAQQSEGITFEDGILLSEQFRKSSDDATDGDLRIMYHNVLAFINASNTRSRFSFYQAIYDHYHPDVIGMQEASAGWKGMAFFDKKNNSNLKYYMQSQNYKLLHADTALAMFYNDSTLNVIQQGSVEVSGNYGSTWALFYHEKSETYFGMINSHFSANSVANSSEHGNTLRVEDAKTVTKAATAILDAARNAGIPTYDSLPIVAGGDYNSLVTEAPISTVIAPFGFVNARDAVTDPTKVDPVATFGNDLSYHTAYQYHTFTTEVDGTGEEAIDHCYLLNADTVTANQYRVVTHPLSGGCSDHHAHYVDISFQ